MKHAEHCGLACTPTLNQTGELNAIFLLHEQVGQLVAEHVLRLSGGEIAALVAPADDRIHHARDQLPHRRLALAACSACRESISKRRYWSPSATMTLGTSTFSCRKITWPFSLPIRAVRRSHSTLSNGDTLPSVKRRWNSSPVARVLPVRFPYANSRPSAFPPSLPPRRQSSRRNVGQACGERANSILPPTSALPSGC